MFCEYFAWRPYSRDTRENSRLSWLFAFQSCALHVAISRVSFSWASLDIHLFFILSLSLHILSHSSLTIKNPHKYREIWLNKITIKFGTELKPAQNSCKLQLYTYHYQSAISTNIKKFCQIFCVHKLSKKEILRGSC